MVPVILSLNKDECFFVSSSFSGNQSSFSDRFSFHFNQTVTLNLRERPTINYVDDKAETPADTPVSDPTKELTEQLLSEYRLNVTEDTSSPSPWRMPVMERVSCRTQLWTVVPEG